MKTNILRVLIGAVIIIPLIAGAQYFSGGANNSTVVGNNSVTYNVNDPFLSSKLSSGYTIAGFTDDGRVIITPMAQPYNGSNADYGYIPGNTPDFFGGTPNDLLVYPNPVISTARISMTELSVSDIRVHIVDMNGNVVRRETHVPGSGVLEVDMSRLPGGIYSVRVWGEGITSHNLKVVKQ